MLEIIKSRKTPNREISILCKAKVVKANDILIYINKDEIEKKCREGCPNYKKKWSCPPYSQSYDIISCQYDNAIVLCLSTEMEKYSDIKNKYLAMKAANVTLKSLIEKVSKKIEKNVYGYALLSGSCRLCKPCQCKQEKPCNHQEKMRYSMEATYLNVSDLSKNVLLHELLWYENKVLPKYTTTVSLILTNCDLNEDDLISFFDF